MIYIKNAHEIELMRKSCSLLKEAFALLEDHIKIGVSTKKLDDIVRNFIEKNNATPSFLNYGGFPASICASVDEVVVHGIPSEKMKLQDGQIIGIDMGLKLNGFHSDCARTFLIGNVSEDKKRLVEITKECFFKGIENISEGNRLGDISSKIQEHAESNGYSVVTALTGHGIGKELHEDPPIPNVGTAGRGVRLQSGMTLAIEPMINMGNPAVEFLSDGWTCRTKDLLPSAHYENTVLITSDGVEILT